MHKGRMSDAGYGKLLRSLSVLLGAIAVAASAHAGIIVNDTWQDATRTDPAAPTYSENGVDSDTDGDIESAWFNSGNTMTASAGHLTTAPPTNGTSSATWTTYFTPEASPVTLNNVGDSMKVTWVFTPSGVNTTNTSQNFRIAVVDAPSANRITADGAPAGSTSYTGYSIFGNMGNTTGSGNSFQLRKRNPASTGSDVQGTSGDWLAFSPNANGLGNGAVGYFSGVTYTFTETMTRNAAGGLDVVATMAGGSGTQAIGGTGSVTASTTDATPAAFTFDMFQIRPSGGATTATSFDTTNFKVEFTAGVPEPTSLSLIALVGTGLFRRRVRR